MQPIQGCLLNVYKYYLDGYERDATLNIMEPHSHIEDIDINFSMLTMLLCGNSFGDFRG
jgi:hypothetical protein